VSKAKNIYRKLKRLLLVISAVALVFWGYVEMVNLKSPAMTTRQKVLKALYPVFTGLQRMLGSKQQNVRVNEKNIPPVTSFYDLQVLLNNGDTLALSALRGKNVLLVNTASDCGYTPQYDELQQLYSEYGKDLVVIGFPANDFKQQEKGSDEEIASFCKINFGVTFPLAKKSIVVRKPGQNPVFDWLTSHSLNGWNDQAPVWNFSKYLVNREGVLTHYFAPAVSPLSEEVTGLVK
jgi:glutathione peroxidase